ncbi:MAG: hypothetical protein LIO90_06320 [Bacteroidales bacterium]|nr:hypothetical protein [Bacteroidales bacterium]
MTDKAFEIAKRFTQRQNFDCIERAGEKNGQEYFHFWRTSTVGLKLGNPLILKVSAKTGKITIVERLDEIMWAYMEARKIRYGEQ